MMWRRYNVTWGVGKHNNTPSFLVNERFQNKLTKEFPLRKILIRVYYRFQFLLNES